MEERLPQLSRAGVVGDIRDALGGLAPQLKGSWMFAAPFSRSCI